MKILLFNFEYPPLGGGGGVATRDLAYWLAKKHTVHVITSRSGDSPSQETVDGVTVHRVPVLRRKDMATASLRSMLSFVPLAWWRGWRLLRAHEFDVVNAQFVIPSGIPAALLARFYGIPFVLSLVGGDLYDPTKGLSPHRHWWLRAIIQLVARQALLCTAISADTRRRAIDIHGITKEIVVTHLGIEQWERPAVIDRSEAFTFMTIGRLIPRKGYRVLLRALRDVADVRVMIVGTGPLKAALTAYARELGVSDRVTLTGFVSEERKRELLCGADAYVSAAEHEGFGLVFLEAMHCGLPIVTTDNGGQADFLKPGVNALLVRPGDTDGLSEAMMRVRDEAQLRSEMAAANQRDVQEFYLERTTARFEEVLRRAVASGV